MITSLSDSRIFKVIKRHQMTNRCPAPRNIAGLVLRLLTVRITELFCQLLQLPIQWRYCYAVITYHGLPVYNLSIAVGCSWNMYHHTIMLSPYYHLIIILWPCYHVIIVCSSSVSKFIRPTGTLSSFVCNSRWRVSMASGKSTGAKPLKPCPEARWSPCLLQAFLERLVLLWPHYERVSHFVRKSFNRSEVEIQIPDSALSSLNISQLDAQKNVNHRKTAVLRVYLTCLLKLESNGIGFCELRKGLCTCWCRVGQVSNLWL